MKSQSHSSELVIRRKPVGPHGAARGGGVDGEGGAQTYRPGASSVSSRPPVGVCRSRDDGGQGRSNPLSQHSNNWTERAAIRLDLRRARPGRTLRRHVPSTPDGEACGRVADMSRVRRVVLVSAAGMGERIIEDFPEGCLLASAVSRK